MEDGSFPVGTTKYEKRGIAVLVPEWQIVVSSATSVPLCPHAVIRPVLLDSEEEKIAPDTFKTLDAKGRA